MTTRWFGRREHASSASSSSMRNNTTTTNSFTMGTPTLTLSSSTLPQDPLPGAAAASGAILARPPQMAFEHHHHQQQHHRSSDHAAPAEFTQPPQPRHSRTIQLCVTHPQSSAVVLETSPTELVPGGGTIGNNNGRKIHHDFAIDLDDDEDFFDDVEFGDGIDVVVHIERGEGSRHRLSPIQWRARSIVVLASVCLAFGLVAIVLLSVAAVHHSKTDSSAATTTAAAVTTSPQTLQLGVDALSSQFSSNLSIPMNLTRGANATTGTNWP